MEKLTIEQKNELFDKSQEVLHSMHDSYLKVKEIKFKGYRDYIKSAVHSLFSVVNKEVNVLIKECEYRRTIELDACFNGFKNIEKCFFNELKKFLTEGEYKAVV